MASSKPDFEVTKTPPKEDLPSNSLPPDRDELGQSSFLRKEQKRLKTEPAALSNERKVHYTSSTKGKSSHAHSKESKGSSWDSTVDSDASDKASLGSLPYTPLHSPSALSEALNAADGTISKLQEANKQLKHLLKESNKDKRRVKEEKNDLIVEVELLGKELDDEKRAHDKVRREVAINTTTPNSASQRSTTPPSRSHRSRYYPESGARYIVPQPPPGNAPNPFIPLSERSSAPAGVTYTPTTTVTYSPVAYSTRPVSARREENPHPLKEVGGLGQELEDERSASNDEDMRRDLKRFREAFREIEETILNVSMGKLDQKMTILPWEMGSEIGSLKESINRMVDEMRDISGQVSRLAEEIGRDGMLGGQVQVPNTKGTWRLMVDNVNEMAIKLTTQVRGITTNIQAVGQGDFDRKIQVECQGEIGGLYKTVDHTIDKLTTAVNAVIKLSSAATREGILGGRINVEGLEGKWRALIDNANSVAHLLTVQKRTVSDVAKRVMQGDTTPLDRDTLARGEIEAMGVALNAMLDDLRRNWTRGTKEVGTADHDQKVQEEKLQRIWTLLHSNI